MKNLINKFLIVIALVSLFLGGTAWADQATTVIANGTGEAVLTELNAAFLAITEQQSGATAPSITYKNMLWKDTSTTPATIRIRNEANNAWIVIGYQDDSGSVFWHVGVINELKASDLASASTVNLGASPGNFVHITGTTTITAFDTVAAGTRRTVKFTGILILTHNGTSLILPTESSITTAAGDTATFISLGSGNWICVQYQRASGQALATSGSYLALTGGSLSGALNEAKGTDISSATTTDIGAATGNYVHVTGTATITGLGTVQAGTRRIVKFTGILILTYNGTSLILPTAANITTAAGDVATFASLGSGNWICTEYQRANGEALVGSNFTGGTLSTELVTAASGSGGAGFNLPHGSAPTTPSNGDFWSTTGGFYGQVNGSTVGPFSSGGSSSSIPAGQVYVSLVSSNIVMMPKNGNQLTIGGSPHAVPSDGVSLAPATATYGAGTVTSGHTYYICAYMSGGTMTLIAADKASYSHMPDTTSGNIGVEVLSSGGSPVTGYTLVGMAYATNTSTWGTGLQVISWFNQRQLSASNTYSTSRGAGQNGWSEMNSEIRIYFLTWGTESISASSNGMAVNAGTGMTSIFVGIAFDSTSAPQNGFKNGFSQGTIVYLLGYYPVNISGNVSLAEGYHYATLLSSSYTGGSFGFNFYGNDDMETNGYTATYLIVGIKG